VPLFTSGGLDLDLVILVLILVLRIWSGLHHWREKAHFGLTRPHRPVIILLTFSAALQCFIFISRSSSLSPSFIPSEKM